jgi:hypothetical protein
LAYAISLELNWFGAYLPVPGGQRAFAVRARRVWHRDGVCWFRPAAEAREAIIHAHILAELLEAGDVPVERVVSQFEFKGPMSHHSK